MVFDTGAKLTGDLVEQIASTFITSGMWHNVDVTWTTTDKSVNNARRVLAYGAAGDVGKGNTILVTNAVNNSTVISVESVANFNITDKIVIDSGSTAEVRVVSNINVPANQLTLDAAINTTHLAGATVKTITFQLYLAMEAMNQPSGPNYYHDGSRWRHGKGFRFMMSTGWDSVAHTSSGTIQSTFVPFETCYNCGVPSDLAILNVTYWLWIEDNGNGFVMMGRPEPSGSPEQQSFTIVLEKIANPANKEYTDNQTDFFLYTVGNIWHQLYDGINTTTLPSLLWRNRSILRPFAYQWPDGAQRGSWGSNGAGISFSPLPSYVGYKSVGNGKVYYIKPIVNNQANQLDPIFQSELFFQWNEGLGLIDGDVIAVQGQPVKFLCKSLSSPDNASRITYAVKYYG